MKTVYLVKNKYGMFEPYDDNTAEIMMNINVGDTFKVKLSKPRTPKYHRKFWALFNRVFENQEKHKTQKTLYLELKLACGWFDEYVKDTGEIVYIPWSLSFDDCDQIKFEELYNQAIQFFLDNYAEGNEQLIDELVRA